jgi:2-keto-4-pentenoate hydratase/2-oxohepta-3-ene-1,7-dioic acid hydratase in catechol pathway
VRLVTYRSGRGERAGIQTDGGIVDAADALGVEEISVRELLASGRLEELDGAEADQVSGEPDLLAPVPDPDKIVCIGLNYRSHAEEAGIDPPESPTFFAKFRNALAPAGAEVPLPAASERVDYEAEIALVVGRRCRGVDAEGALEAIAGYMLLNDLSARDLQLATPQWMPGKVFDGSAPCGPALVTPEEAGPHDRISFALDLNGERMQEASTDDLIFSAPELVSRLSGLMTLEPGDIVSTGTPSGVGSARDPQIWLQPGDQIVISSPTLGRLETAISR